MWNTAPPVMELLLGFVLSPSPAAEAVRARFRRLPLRLVMLSGDFMSLQTSGQLYRLLPSVRVVSLGGATECAIWSCWFEVPRKLDPQWPVAAIYRTDVSLFDGRYPHELDWESPVD